MRELLYMGYDYDNKDGFTPLSANRHANYGDFLRWMGQYVFNGEYAVIFADKRSPYRLIKVINLDLTDGDSNWGQADFFEENWQKDIEGLVKVYAFTKFIATKPMMLTLTNKIIEGASNIIKITQILDMDENDEMSMWLMEKVDYVGLTHPDLSKTEMIDLVASAAHNIGTRTGYALTDLKPQNYGFRNDGSAVIFDFNLEVAEQNYWMGRDMKSFEDYKYMITSASNTKV